MPKTIATPFLRSFTNAGGLSEKNRLKVGPSDQPVMYAAMVVTLEDPWR